MTPAVVVAAADSADHAAALAAATGCELAEGQVRRFPDGELYIRIETDLAGRTVWVVSTLHPADRGLMSAFLAAHTARDLGAATVHLVAPYLAYLRQDERFHPGEGVTSRYVSQLVASAFDGLVTCDPHLHRIDSLDELYAIPSQVVSSAPAIADWIASNVAAPCLIGPDAESEQWVAAVAAIAGCPYLVLEKLRRGDRDVSVSSIDADLAQSRGIDLTTQTAVVLDDIASTGHTMIEAMGSLRVAGAQAIECIAIHPLFAGDALERIRQAGASRVVSCNTLPHPTNAIDVLPALADGMRALSQ